MEQRRFFLFLVLSMSILIGWTTIGPKLFPGMFPKPRKPHPVAVDDAASDQQDAENAAARPDVGEDGRQTATAGTETASKNADSSNGKPREGTADDNAAATAVETAPPESKPPVAESDEGVKPDVALPTFPHREITLGSTDPATGYFQTVRLTTRGAAILQIALNDPRYKDLKDRTKPLQIVGPAVNDLGEELTTLTSSIPMLDEAFKPFKTDLTRWDWEVLETTLDPTRPKITSGATFRAYSPDKTIEIRKTFQLNAVSHATGDIVAEETRDTNPDGYELQVDLSLINHAQAEFTLQYTLQGPVGLPLENAENTRKYRDIKVGFREDDGTIDAQSVTAGHIHDGAADKTIEDLKPAPRTFKYVAVDIQYFASALLPQDDAIAGQGGYLAVATPMLVHKDKTKAKSDISFRLQSNPILLAAGETVTHSYILYTGPKRPKLLEPIGATGIQDFGWFGSVSTVMLVILKFFHNWGLPYGIAIVILTVLVRGCMYPVSRKQAAGAKKMKELQPQLAELKKKYGNNKEEFARKQMELFSKAGYNPLSGCLPIVLQLPIFFGLYRALNNSVDLRMASFLYIDNLAAPDALFRMPFSLPFLGSDFNLLPLLTVVLFVVQQKMFMPPPTDDQSAMQQKMMNYMMIFMGFLFYRMPAGLCVYFIASSLWGLGERKMLDYGKKSSDDVEPKPPVKKPPVTPSSDTPKRENFFTRMAKQLDEAAKMQQQTSSRRNASKSNSDGRSGKRKSKNSRSKR